MGDVRFDAALARAERARREGALDELSADTGIQALGALAARANPVMANVLATRLLNQVRRSATLLRFVAEGVVALDAEGRVLFANPAAERILGWAEGALLGRDFHDAVHHRKRWGAEVAREDCVILKAIERGADEEPLPVDDHDLFQRKDGSTFLAGFVAAPIFHQGEATGIALVFRDITPQKDREATLALYGAALDAVPAPVFWLGRDGGILYANDAAAHHLGYARDELTRMRVFDFDPDVKPEQWDERWRRIKEGQVASIDSHHRTREGEVVPVRIRIQHVDHEGSEFHVAIVQRRKGP